jgi:branched-chain amino acid transport system substrate-binding protein
MGPDANYLFNTDPISIWLTNQKTLDAKLPPVIKLIGEEFDKVKPGVAIRSAHVGMAASNTFLLMTEVLPRAIKKYGGIDPDALRKAAMEIDIPEGGTMLGFGVKFPAEGAAMAGQNERSFPVVIQYVDDKSYVVCPRARPCAKPCCRCRRHDPTAASRRSRKKPTCLLSRGWSSVSAVSRPSTTCPSRSIRARFSA